LLRNNLENSDHISRLNPDTKDLQNRSDLTIWGNLPILSKLFAKVIKIRKVRRLCYTKYPLIGQSLKRFFLLSCLCWNFVPLNINDKLNSRNINILSFLITLFFMNIFSMKLRVDSGRSDPNSADPDQKSYRSFLISFNTTCFCTNYKYAFT